MSAADLLPRFRRIILANELDNNLDYAYRFADADGIGTGKSGFSFGITQLDIANNPSATLCLRECGFTTDEIAALRKQNVAPLAPFNAKLHAAMDTVDHWDAKQLQECLTVPLYLCERTGIAFADDEARLHLADYHNQFYMSEGGKMHTALLKLQRPVTREDIFAIKLKMAWGIKRPDDVRRRYNNIVSICGAA